MSILLDLNDFGIYMSVHEILNKVCSYISTLIYVSKSSMLNEHPRICQNPVVP